MPIASVIHTGAASLDRVLAAGVPVLLVFAPSSPLPAELHGVLEGLAERFAGRLLIARVDARAEPELVARFGVRQTPTVVVVRNNETLERLAGSMRAGDVEAWVHYLLENGPRPAPVRPQPESVAPPPPASAPRGGGGGALPLVLTDATFAQTLQSPLPVLVDFWAAWCGPCRTIAPSVERLAADYAGRAIVAKLNVDENPQTPGQFGIRGIPTLLIFRQGKVVDQIVGAQPYAALEQRLRAAVAQV